MTLSPTHAHYRGQDPVNLLAPRAEDIDFEVIADRLSKIYRFLGGTIAPYSVAQHSVWVMDRVRREAQPYALLHDAHEAFIGDPSRPLLLALDRMAAAHIPSPYRRSFSTDLVSMATRALAGAWDIEIFKAAGLNASQPKDMWDEIKKADDHACDVEYRALILDERVVGAPTPVSSERAKAEFLAALKAVCPRARGLS
jgi:uncharacterized protein